jgi:hypothetical protein
MATNDTPITLAEARRLAANTARAEAFLRADAEGRVQRRQIPFRVTQRIRISGKRARSEQGQPPRSEHGLERIKALWTADTELAKEIATQRAALLAELLAEAAAV